MHRFVYLASQSPRRRQLLEQIGVPHELLLPDRKENAERLEEERSGELPADYVRRVTGLKLAAARARLARRGLPDAPILASDTTVALGRRILGKPRDAADAAEMLHALAGRTHRVLTAVAVSAGRTTLLEMNVSRVRFTELSAQDVRRYIDSGEPFGKAGAYGIQGAAARWVSHIEGSYSGIMGLPLYETAQLLRRARVMF
ncbi:Maf family protein [Aquincola sp. MAHUQ-54]|uniref:dTTP/UTP pyrophosphatase n=1 Tax=Aquincola agrisoli TaxID=3119538 RepID=A0AAW9QKR3_9BURK